MLEKEDLALSTRLLSCCGVKEKIIRRFYEVGVPDWSKKTKQITMTLKRWPSWKQELNQEDEKEQWPRFNIKQPQNSWKCFRTKPASLPHHLPVSAKHHCSTSYQNQTTIMNKRHVTSLSSSLLSYNIFGLYSTVSWCAACSITALWLLKLLDNNIFITVTNIHGLITQVIRRTCAVIDNPTQRLCHTFFIYQTYIEIYIYISSFSWHCWKGDHSGCCLLWES